MWAGAGADASVQPQSKPGLEIPTVAKSVNHSTGQIPVLDVNMGLDTFYVWVAGRLE